jgi:hypothetical protein
MILVVPIVFAAALPFIYGYNIYGLVGGDASIEGFTATRNLATALFFWSMALIFGAVPLAVFICNRNNCLDDDKKIRCWYRAVSASFVYLMLTLGAAYAFFSLSSALVSGLLSIAAIIVACLYAYGEYWHLKAKWATVLFTVSILINVGLAVYALSGW